MGDLGRNVRVGLGWGLAFAAVYCVYVVALRLLRGPEPFHAAGTSLAAVMIAYCAGGLVGGGAFGVLLPLGRSRTGSAILGFIVALPVMFAMGMAIEPPERWLTRVPLASLLAAGVLGPICGVAMWYVNERFERF